MENAFLPLSLSLPPKRPSNNNKKIRPVERRGRDIGALFNRAILNPESNLCYGEGGAGTWSDGKLTTRIGRNSENVRKVSTASHLLLHLHGYTHTCVCMRRMGRRRALAAFCGRFRWLFAAVVAGCCFVAACCTSMSAVRIRTVCWSAKEHNQVRHHGQRSYEMLFLF